MNGMRETLKQLGWSSDLIDAFLESALSNAIDPEQTQSASVQAYVDQPNMVIELHSATLLSGVALRSNKKTRRQQPKT